MKPDEFPRGPTQPTGARRGWWLWGVPLAALAALTGCAGPVLAPNLGDADLPARVELADTPFFPQEAYDCGPAALATLLSTSGVAVTADALVEAVYLPERRGSLQAEIVAAARRYDRVPYVIEPTLAAAFAELAAGRPVLVMQNLASAADPVWHYAVLVGYSMDDDTVVLRSGTEARQVVSARRFLGTWARASGWAMVALRPGELPAYADRGRYAASVAAMEGVASPEAVLAAYAAGLERWPEDVTAQFGAANTLYATGNAEAAEQAYRRLLRRAPDHVATRNNLATLLSERGCYREALELLAPALTRDDIAPALRAALEDTERTVRAGLRTAGTQDCNGADGR